MEIKVDGKRFYALRHGQEYVNTQYYCCLIKQILD